MENGAIHVQQLKDIQWGTPSGFVHITDWEVHEFEPNGEVSHGAGEVTVINSFTLPNPYE